MDYCSWSRIINLSPTHTGGAITEARPGKPAEGVLMHTLYMLLCVCVCAGNGKKGAAARYLPAAVADPIVVGEFGLYPPARRCAIFFFFVVETFAPRTHEFIPPECECVVSNTGFCEIPASIYTIYINFMMEALPCTA